MKNLKNITEKEKKYLLKKRFEDYSQLDQLNFIKLCLCSIIKLCKNFNNGTIEKLPQIILETNKIYNKIWYEGLEVSFIHFDIISFVIRFETFQSNWNFLDKNINENIFNQILYLFQLYFLLFYHYLQKEDMEIIFSCQNNPYIKTTLKIIYESNSYIHKIYRQLEI